MALLAETAIGAITVGSITVPPRAGNEAIYGYPTYHYDRKTRTTYNSMGLPNVGLEAFVKLAPELLETAHAKDKPLIVSASPAETSRQNGGDSIEQTKRLTSGLLEAEADLIEVNTSCPNIVTSENGRKPILGYDLEAMGKLLGALYVTASGAESRKIGLKLPPYISPEEKSLAAELSELLRNNSSAFGYLVTANTIPSQVATDALGKPILSVPGGSGGASGPSTRITGREQLHMWRQLMGESVDIVSNLGLKSGIELAVRRKIGAAAAGGVTFLWESKDWGVAVTDMISQWVEAEEVAA